MANGEHSVVGFGKVGETVELNLFLVLDTLGSIVKELKGSSSDPPPDRGVQNLVKTPTDGRKVLTY